MKTIKSFILILVFFLMVLPSAFAKIEANLLKPQDFLGGPSKKQKIRKTITKLEQAISEDPDNYELYEMLAFVCDRGRFYEKSLEALKQTIKYYPEGEKGLDILYGNIARTYIILDRLDEAKPIIDKSLELNSKNIVNHIILVEYYVLKNKYKEAALELKLLTELDETVDFYHELYASKLDKGEKYDNLVALFREAVAVNPGSHLSHRTLGTAIRNSVNNFEENFPLAMAEYEKALEIDPKYLPTYISVGDAYMLLAVKTENREYFEDALAWLNKGSEIDPGNARIAYVIGEVYFRMENYDEAAKKLEYAINEGIDEPRIINMLAVACNNKAYALYAEGKKLDQALELINKALRLNPKDGISLGTKAEILYKLERYEEAYEYIKRALVLEPDYEEMKQDLVNIEEAMKWDTGKEAREIAIEKGILPKNIDEAVIKDLLERKDVLSLWLIADRLKKIRIVDRMKALAYEDGVIIRSHSEYYVEEINKGLYTSIKNEDKHNNMANPVEFVFKLIALEQGDYDNGMGKVEALRDYAGDELFEWYKTMCPKKYQYLVEMDKQ